MLTKHAPILCFFLYIIVGYLLFENGPWPWPVSDYWPIRAYFTLSLASIFLGYYLAHFIPLSFQRNYFTQQIISLKVIIILAFFDVLIISIARTGSIIPNVFFGLSDPGAAYSEFVYKSFNRGYWTYLEYANVALHFSFIISSVCVFIFWSQLSRFYKFLGITTVLYYIFIHVSIGVSKGVVAILLPLPITLFFLHIAKSKMSINKVVKWSLAVLVLFIVFMMFFTHIQLGRDAKGINLGKFGPPISIIAERNKNLPQGFSIAYESLTRYVDQGYYALSEGLASEGYSFGYGVGSSMFLMRKFEPVLGEDWKNNTLLFKLEQDIGWGVFKLWHSLPLWLINGFGVLGSLVVLFFFGYVYGRCWRGLRIHITPVTCGLFLILNTIFLYFSANNQVFQNADSTVSFVIILLLAVISKYTSLPSIFRDRRSIR